MKEPNEAIREILKERDVEFRQLQEKLDALQKKLQMSTDESTRKQLFKQIRNLSDEVNARISFARSA